MFPMTIRKKMIFNGRGCAIQREPEGNGGDQAPEKVKVTAYINVSSGCQTETVALLTQLAKDNEELNGDG